MVLDSHKLMGASGEAGDRFLIRGNFSESMKLLQHFQILQKPIRASPELPPLCANYPWLVTQNLEEAEDDQIFYTVHDPLSQYRSRIPELVGRRIQAIFHGWVILTKHPHKIEWFLWNPVTSNLICLPDLILNDEILYCCLSSPPDDPASILLLTTTTKPKFVFCRLADRKLKWTEWSYSKQLRSVSHFEDDGILQQPTCCNGKVYAFTFTTNLVIQVNIVVNDEEIVISLSRFVSLPNVHGAGIGRNCRINGWKIFLKGSCPQLFVITLYFSVLTKLNPIDVYLHKLDMSSMMWVEMDDLKGTDFCVDTEFNQSVTCSPAIASELGGYIHILHEKGKVIYSCDVKDKTISLSSIHGDHLSPRSTISLSSIHGDHLPPRSQDSQESRISVWAMPGFRLEGDDDGEAKCRVDSKQDEGKEDEMVVRSTMINDEIKLNEQNNEAEVRLLNIPFHLLEMIMEFCVGIEYLNFRATNKRCHLAAPMIRLWSNIKARERLQPSSLLSPWLVVFEEHQGIISLTDPRFGDKYFIKASPTELFYHTTVLCSGYGWLLLLLSSKDNGRVAFFNPFTGDIHKLPRVARLWSYCFSAPPTSPDCMVVGLSSSLYDRHVHVYLAGEPSWRRIILDFGATNPVFHFPIFCGRDVYALFHKGGLRVFREINNDISWETIVHQDHDRSYREEYFLVKCDQHFLKVIVGEFGESVEVLKLNDLTREWENMNGLGRHMIYICGATCLCMDAKVPDMENKIYFSRLYSDKLVFYSFETCSYHTVNGGGNVVETLRNFFGTKGHGYAHAWIEPVW